MNHRLRQTLGAAALLLVPALAAGCDIDPGHDAGGAGVTVRDFEARLDEVPEKHRRGMADDPQRLGQLLEQIVRQRLLADRARQAGLAERPDVKARLELARDQALAKAMLDDVREKAEPADYEQLAREHYLTNPDEFMAPERITVSHVLVSTEERPEEEARALADQIIAAARGGEKPFEDLVREYSAERGQERGTAYRRRAGPDGGALRGGGIRPRGARRTGGPGRDPFWFPRDPAREPQARGKAAV